VDFAFTDDQQNIRDAVLAQCSQFSDDYWLARDRDAQYPVEFHTAMAQAGWLGVAMPESVGGAGLGITEAAIMMQAVAEAGGGMTAASTIHGPVFSLEPIDLFGTEEQKQRMIPPNPIPGWTRPSSRPAPCAKRAAIASMAKRSGSPTPMSPTG
jgi:acyl-CoA dehydrogenase